MYFGDFWKTFCLHHECCWLFRHTFSSLIFIMIQFVSSPDRLVSVMSAKHLA